ncbi:uncharacterized protein [Chelonus insularis]|uniref:uncharacterized protein n=1 Tax=Chelonus insularis TaxID=460826 RepID=UPI00158E7E9C|nr:uncharacterized protein LOC118075003 [Chelonus insularis]
MDENTTNRSSENVIGEFTLEDTYDHLKEVQQELHEQMDELLNICTNNQVETLTADSTPKDVQLKQSRMLQSLLNNPCDYDHKSQPIAHTKDSYALTVWELEQEVARMEDVVKDLSESLNKSKNNITYLENRISTIDRMKEICLDATENVTNTTYDAEMKIAKEMFSSVKHDLASVVDMVLPDNDGFNELLAKLTKAHAKGGDNVYIDVDPYFLDCIEFLIEADIVTYHRNDKNKIRLMDLV